MSKKPFLIKANWTISHGTDIENTISVEHIADASLAKSSNIDDFTGAQRAVLLTKAIKPQEPDLCHIKLQTKPQYATPQITLICDCSKIELFTGSYEEYLQICHGELLDEFEGTKSYIFELHFPRTVNDVLLKFITKQEQIWIYGIHMYLIEEKENIFRPSINIDNVQAMLTESNHNLSETAEKCKEFIKMHLNRPATIAGPPNLTALMSIINGKMVNHNCANETNEKKSNGSDSIPIDTPQTLSDTTRTNGVIINLIESRLKHLEHSLEMKINARFDQLEQQQNEKFQQIIEMLQERK